MNGPLTRARTFFQLQRGLLFRYGWLRSWWEGKPVDNEGRPLPWLAYPAIDFLTQFDFSQSFVFEWGSGYSTLWWSARCRHITTVESNLKWISDFRDLLPTSVELLQTSFEVQAEVSALRKHARTHHDVIVIDNHGPFRWQCAAAAIDHLSRGGMIILDNSDQCLKACEVLRTHDFVQVDFSGFAPSNSYAQTTSIFFQDFLKFHTVDSIQPHRSPAQPNLPWQNC